MRKIKKTNILSTQYKSWEESFEEQDSNHPKYSSSKNEHYIDVVINLLNAQEGLCAYTEMRLCPAALIGNDNWQNGKYINRHPEIKGQLDHFDPSLKSNRGWLWKNFFFIDTDINTKVKGKQNVDNILKPDEPCYSENALLEYDPENHIFIANTKLDSEIRDRINSMILKLGINFGPVIDLRKDYLRNILAMKKFGLDYEVTQFPSAFTMCTEQIPEDYYSGKKD
jgi:hypothetical protein